MEKYHEARSVLFECLSECYRQQRLVENRLEAVKWMISLLNSGANPERIRDDAEYLYQELTK